jgi:hypothetical protein
MSVTTEQMLQTVAETGVTESGVAVSDELLAAVQAYAERTKYLDKLGETLESQKDEAAIWRREYESRWEKSLRQFNTGIVDNLPWAKDNNQRTDTGHEKFQRAPDNITRAKTLAIIARRQDMLFTGRNWGLRPSPDASLPDFAMAPIIAAEQNGASPRMVEAMKKAEAKRRCRNMERKINDVLEESRYSKHGRQATRDSCIIGTGVIEGPFPMVVQRRVYNAQTGATDAVYDIVSRVEAVDPACFFPQPCRHIEEASYAFRLHIMSKTQVRGLINQPGFDPDQINRLLGMPPSLGVLTNNVTQSGGSASAGDSKILAGRYPIWKYRGPVPREALMYFGFGIPEDDHTTEFMGEIWMSMGVVIKATLAADDWNPRLPYYVINYERDPDSCFGFGVPDVIAADQDTANIAWSAAKLNAMASAKPMMGMVKQYLVQEEGNYDLTQIGPFILKGVDDIRKAISFATVPSTSDSILRIFEMAKRGADEHLLLPAAAGGDAAMPTAQTASGLAMVMNAGNIVQRHAANEWDDEVTIPLITALVNYEMEYGEDMEAKGDFDVVPIASTQLLVRDVRIQQGMALLELAQRNPVIGARIDTDVIAGIVLQDLQFPVEDALRSDEEVAELREKMSQQPDPETLKAQTALERQQIESETRMFEAQSANEREMMKVEGNIRVAEINRESELAKLAQQDQAQAREIMKELRIAEGEQALTKSMADMRTAVAARNQDMRDYIERLRLAQKSVTEAARLEDRRESRTVQQQVETPVRIAQ